MNRRDLLKSAAATPLLGSLGRLASLFVRERTRRSLIILWLDGGMSHVDTFDGKPEAPPDIRGELVTKFLAPDQRGPAMPGDVAISEHLPRIAGVLRRCALVRTVSSGEGNHDRGSHYMLTGHRPSPVLTYPSVGSWLGLVDPARDSALPDYVALGSAPPYGKQGFLGPTRLPFEPGGAPQRPDFRVRHLSAPPGRKRALALLRAQDAASEAASLAEAARDRFVEQARALSEDPDARRVFELGREKPELRARYGRHALGQSCLLARRLVEAGTRVVLVRDRGWDMHQSILRRMTYGFPPKLSALDSAFATLVEDLDARGLAERTLVLVAGEFGRTPRVNPSGGRDHWPRAHSAVLFGAGLRRGIVVGRTDARGEEPIERPVSPADLVATLIAALGVDLETQLHTPDGRPIPLVERGAAPVREVLVP